MKGFVIKMLKKKLPVSYCYHNCEHTLYVMEKVVEIAKQENCTAQEINLLSTAALWHDAGYIHTYYGHEEEGCTLAGQYLPGYGFSINEINKIAGMIMATKMPQTPKNKLEEIIADADLEYLGTMNAAEKADLLFEELHSLTPALTKAAWNKMQIAFLQLHHYYTPYCKKLKEPLKTAYLNELLEGQ